MQFEGKQNVRYIGKTREEVERILPEEDRQYAEQEIEGWRNLFKTEKEIEPTPQLIETPDANLLASIRENIGILETDPITTACREAAYEEYRTQMYSLDYTNKHAPTEREVMEGFEEDYWNPHKEEILYGLIEEGYLQLPKKEQN